MFLMISHVLAHCGDIILFKELDSHISLESIQVNLAIRSWHTIASIDIILVIDLERLHISQISVILILWLGLLRAILPLIIVQ